MITQEQRAQPHRPTLTAAEPPPPSLPASAHSGLATRWNDGADKWPAPRRSPTSAARLADTTRDQGDGGRSCEPAVDNALCTASPGAVSRRPPHNVSFALSSKR